MSDRVTRAGLIGGALLSLAFLAGSGVPGAMAGPGPAAKPVPGAETSRSVGKPRPPVDVLLVPGSQLESGVPGILVMEVRSAAGIEDVELAVQGDDHLTVVSPARAAPAMRAEGSPLVGPLEAEAVGEAARFEIAVTPSAGGTRRLSGLVTFAVGGVVQAVPFNLEVAVGGPATVPPAGSRKPEREAKRDAAGELIDSMPAETTVR